MASDRPTLILASASPRRTDLLTRLGVAFDRRPVDVDETPLDGEEPMAMVRRLAEAKARAASGDGEVILAADTIVVIDGEILGKPQTPSDAEAMLGRLCGRAHMVHTGVAVAADPANVNVEVESTKVELIALDRDTIHRYVATGEPMDKAGAYAIQGLGAAFVARIHGSCSNVVGLPLTLTRTMLAPHGIELPSLRSPIATAIDA